jgi:flagellar hook protein FlgE
MTFNIGLSGLSAANKALNVTGNNIANVATTGFKSSRAEFADQYAASIRATAGKTSRRFPAVHSGQHRVDRAEP